LISIVIVLVPLAAEAQATLVDTLGGPLGFGVDTLPPEDDVASAAIDLTPVFPTGLRLFGVQHTSVFVNNNGNVSFVDASPTFEIDPLPSGVVPGIAVYQGDVDTTGPGGDNTVYWAVDAARQGVDLEGR
jgi:hypothetical protein